MDEDDDMDDDDQPRKPRGDDIDELDFDIDFQDDEEMGLETVHDDAKENEEQLKKKQNRLNPVSESDSESDDEKKPDLNDPSVRKLKRMVGDDEDLDSESDSDAPVVAIKRMELPPAPAKPDSATKNDSKKDPKSANKPSKPNLSKSGLDGKHTKKSNLDSPRSQKRRSPNPPSRDQPEKIVKVEPKSSQPSSAAAVSLPTPEMVVKIVKSNPGIVMKDLVQKLGLKTLKVNAEQRKKIIDMLHQVVYKPKGSESLMIHTKYQSA